MHKKSSHTDRIHDVGILISPFPRQKFGTFKNFSRRRNLWKTHKNQGCGYGHGAGNSVQKGSVMNVEGVILRNDKRIRKNGGKPPFDKIEQPQKRALLCRFKTDPL